MRLWFALFIGCIKIALSNRQSVGIWMHVNFETDEFLSFLIIINRAITCLGFSEISGVFVTPTALMCSPLKII